MLRSSLERELRDKFKRRRVEKVLFRDEIELYDVVEDTAEVRNLADDPRHASAKQRMLARLHERLTATNDPWLFRYAVPGRGAKR